jgi:hypothetical protein
MTEITDSLAQGARLIAKAFYEAMPEDIGNVFAEDDRGEQLAYFICWYELMRPDFKMEERDED